MPKIEMLKAVEILDSRGEPTVKAFCQLGGGICGTASVPAGASRGVSEAKELRDGDVERYRGRGCLDAVSIINGEINTAFQGRDSSDLVTFEQTLLKLDGTSEKSRLGANSILAVSLAFARALAMHRKIPLYRYFSGFLSNPVKVLPMPLINLFSGGTHAGHQVSMQDVQVVPLAAQTMAEALAMVFEVFQCAAELSQHKYGARKLTADEGGLAPPFQNAEQMLEDTVSSITAAGFAVGKEIAIAIDVAASHFYREGCYFLDDRKTDSSRMTERIGNWVKDYPVISVEDGLAEEDWAFWPVLCRELRGKALTLGDDLLCTNPVRIGKAIEAQAADALLLKVNQIGSLNEAAESLKLARSAGWDVVFSARSGETEDSWLADLTVGWGGKKIKIGSITQSERLAKYNRLLQIEAETGMPLAEW